MRNSFRSEAMAVCSFTIMKVIVTGLFFFVVHETALQALLLFVVPFVCAAAYAASKTVGVLLLLVLLAALLLWTAALLLSLVDLLRRNRKSDLPRRLMLGCFCAANGIEAVCYLVSLLNSFYVPKLIGLLISLAITCLALRRMKKPE